jgi:nitrogen fixation protein FixH
MSMPGWFKALAVICVSAAIANGVMVWQALHVRRDLVRKDYYEAGLDQDGRIARTARAQAGGLRINFTPDAEGFRLEASGGRDTGALAASDPLSFPSCRADFYRPDDGREDITLQFQRTVGGDAGASVWRAPARKLRRGFWRVTFVWADGRDAVMEKTIDFFSPG